MRKKSFPFFLSVSLLIHVSALGIVTLTNLQDLFFNKRRILSSAKVNLSGLPEKQLLSPPLEKKPTLPEKTSPNPISKKPDPSRKPPKLTQKKILSSKKKQVV